MNNRFQKYIAIITALLLLAGMINMPFFTTEVYAGSFTDRAKEAASKGRKAVSENVKGAAQKGKDAVSKGSKATSEQLKKWKAQVDKKEFKKGWDKAVEFATSDFAARQGSKYVENVANAIETFRLDINMSKGAARGVAQEAGYIAEKWHTDTFNIDSALKESSSKATTPGSNGFATPDIITNYGEKASLKYYKTATKSANQQAKTVIEKYSEYAAKTENPMSLNDYLDKHGYDQATQDELLSSVYEGQTRIIPKDQYTDAVEYLSGRVDKLSKLEGDVPAARAKSYQETMDSLSDRLKDPKGTQSRPATYDELQAVSEMAEKGDFKPEDFGFTLSQIITPKYIVKQAVNTGGKTAAIKIAIDLGPDIYKIIVEGIETGEIDKEELKKLGIDGLESGTEGFIEGSVSCAILTACQGGMLGQALTNASPDVVGALTIIAIDSVRYGYALSKGDITPMQFGDLMAEDVIVSSGALAAGAGLSMLFGGSVIICMAGCLAGGMLASMGYTMGKEAALEVRDAGGFAAVVPVDSVKGTLLNKKEIAALKLKDTATNIKGMTLNTMNDGRIVIDMAKGKKNNETDYLIVY